MVRDSPPGGSNHLTNASAKVLVLMEGSEPHLTVRKAVEQQPASQRHTYEE